MATPPIQNRENFISQSQVKNNQLPATPLFTPSASIKKDDWQKLAAAHSCKNTDIDNSKQIVLEKFKNNLHEYLLTNPDLTFEQLLDSFLNARSTNTAAPNSTINEITTTSNQSTQISDTSSINNCDPFIYSQLLSMNKGQKIFNATFFPQYWIKSFAIFMHLVIAHKKISNNNLYKSNNNTLDIINTIAYLKEIASTSNNQLILEFAEKLDNAQNRAKEFFYRNRIKPFESISKQEIVTKIIINQYNSAQINKKNEQYQIAYQKQMQFFIRTTINKLKIELNNKLHIFQNDRAIKMQLDQFIDRTNIELNKIEADMLLSLINNQFHIIQNNINPVNININNYNEIINQQFNINTKIQEFMQLINITKINGLLKTLEQTINTKQDEAKILIESFKNTIACNQSEIQFILTRLQIPSNNDAVAMQQQNMQQALLILTQIDSQYKNNNFVNDTTVLNCKKNNTQELYNNIQLFMALLYQTQTELNHHALSVKNHQTELSQTELYNLLLNYEQMLLIENNKFTLQDNINNINNDINNLYSCNNLIDNIIVKEKILLKINENKKINENNLIIVQKLDIIFNNHLLDNKYKIKRLQLNKIIDQFNITANILISGQNVINFNLYDKFFEMMELEKQIQDLMNEIKIFTKESFCTISINNQIIAANILSENILNSDFALYLKIKPNDEKLNFDSLLLQLFDRIIFDTKVKSVANKKCNESQLLELISKHKKFTNIAIQNELDGIEKVVTQNHNIQSYIITQLDLLKHNNENIDIVNYNILMIKNMIIIKELVLMIDKDSNINDKLQSLIRVVAFQFINFANVIIFQRPDLLYSYVEEIKDTTIKQQKLQLEYINQMNKIKLSHKLTLSDNPEDNNDNDYIDTNESKHLINVINNIELDEQQLLINKLEALHKNILNLATNSYNDLMAFFVRNAFSANHNHMESLFNELQQMTLAAYVYLLSFKDK